jgi:hypothetical protein
VTTMTTGTTGNGVRARTPDPAVDREPTSFSPLHERDGVTLVTATRSGTRRNGTVTARPVGAFVVRDGTVCWRPAVDVTRLLTAAEVVVGAVLVAHRLSRRPSTPKAHVTMGPGGWVSMKGGTVAVRESRRPFGRPRPVDARPCERRPLWARAISAVPLRSLSR